MKILGNRVYLDMPELPEFKTTVPDSLKEEIKKETAAKFEKMTVFESGVENIKKGDIVAVDGPALQKGRIIRIKDSDKLVVSAFDIMHIWEEDD